MTTPVLTPGQAALSILVMAAVTFLTRALPFLLFDHGDHPPRIILYLGSVLPPAIITMLIVYCLKDVTFAGPFSAPNPDGGIFGGWLSVLLASLTALGLHTWKRNDLLSIFGATILYMLLIRLDLAAVSAWFQGIFA